MFSPEFTCEKCGYASEHLLMVCPECSHSIGGEKKAEPTPPSHLTPTGKYLAPVDPLAVKRSNIKVIQVFKLLCGIFALCVAFLVVPFGIIPGIQGPDASGYYTMPKGRSQSAPSKVTGGAIQGGIVAIIVISALLGGGYLFLKKKEEQMVADFLAEGHEL